VNNVPEAKDWYATRQTKNAGSKTGISDPTSGDIRCYTSTTAANVMTVPAGSTVHYISTQQINHPGPTQYYLAKVPAGSDVKSWDGSGAVWFKISTTEPSVDANKQMTWPNQSMFPPSTSPPSPLTHTSSLFRHLCDRQHHHPYCNPIRRLPSSS
jgi:hypothetical protein